MRKRIGSFLSKAIPFRAKGYGFFDLVRYTSHRLDILYLGKDYAHPLDILHIVYFHLHLSFEHSVFRLNQQADDIDIEVSDIVRVIVFNTPIESIPLISSVASNEE